MTNTPKLTQGLQTVITSTEDFVAFGKGNLEAFATSGKIWAAGVQQLSAQVAVTAKGFIETSVANLQAISTVKSVPEAIAVQTDISRAVVAKLLDGSNKLTDTAFKLTADTLAPLTARVAVAAETFARAA
jgi:phasin family protein